MIHIQRLPSFQTVILVSIVLRIALILYSEWHDARSVVKYTDVDYRVFSDAARFILHPTSQNVARGPWSLAFEKYFGFQVGDPYTRETYRYTPLLALLLVPNEFIHPSFGKYLFAGADILNGLLIYRLLIDVILPSSTSSIPKTSDNAQAPTNHTSVSPGLDLILSHRATFLTSLHLFNPLVFTISTRGSSESILSTFVLLTLFCALTRRWGWAAALLGLSVHWKIYPVIYGVGCLGVVDTDEGGVCGRKGWAATLVNQRTIRFGMISAGTFLTLGGVCYVIWGYSFLYESYLYHLHRLDHRHNFSPYFYLTYLTYPSFATSSPLPLWRKALRSPLTSFAPQMTLTMGSGLMLGKRRNDLVFTWFVQTVLFVLFNKVCTSQYFLWYLLFLPLLFPSLSIPLKRIIACLAVWIGTQALWLSEAYRLEFLGESVFLGLWARSLAYVVGNGWVLMSIMDGYQRSSSLGGNQGPCEFDSVGNRK